MLWIESEVQKLREATSSLTAQKGQINWNAVSQHISTRSPVQCKSYYANVLKKTLDVEINRHHMWTRKEVVTLWTYYCVYGNDYCTIQKLMASFTVKQISSQLVQILTKSKVIQSDFNKISSNRQQVEQLGKKEFLLQLSILQTAEQLTRRKPSLDKAHSCAVQMGLKAVSTFFGDIQLARLHNVYAAELERRAYEDYEERICRFSFEEIL
ncbi:Myb-like_DNA-binding domain-containing protein [Hexamita inflata]|uniref:Myb-like DNA-binding domain-containing protein n=1 Tax=Hexamita inflata TaxID=28002 RepID=A0AA86QGF1_9EUKA|nr:Myb-like DNA-binding domain-containing protein [Hexamita inflata]CAI9952774.1 Myb-like DNA-binding domain-containing protein [Hexamita inflata]